MANPLNDQQIEAISTAVFARRKIDAIKLYRQATGVGLKEAKDFVEALESRLEQQSPERFAPQQSAIGCASVVLAVVILMGFALWFLIS